MPCGMCPCMYLVMGFSLWRDWTCNTTQIKSHIIHSYSFAQNWISICVIYNFDLNWSNCAQSCIIMCVNNTCYQFISSRDAKKQQGHYVPHSKKTRIKVCRGNFLSKWVPGLPNRGHQPMWLTISFYAKLDANNLSLRDCWFRKCLC